MNEEKYFKFKKKIRHFFKKQRKDEDEANEGICLYVFVLHSS